MGVNRTISRLEALFTADYSAAVADESECGNEGVRWPRGRVASVGGQRSNQRPSQNCQHRTCHAIRTCKYARPLRKEGTLAVNALPALACLGLAPELLSGRLGTRNARSFRRPGASCEPLHDCDHQSRDCLLIVAEPGGPPRSESLYSLTALML